MAREATVAQILINDVLPEDLRDYHRVLDKKGLNNLLREVASRYPDRYREISHRLNQLGGKIAFESGGNSPLVEHLQPPEAVKKFKARIEPQLQAVIDNRALSGERRNQQIVDLLSGEMGPLQQAVFQELKEKNNPLARQILSGARGNALQLSSLVAADLLYADNRDRPIPLPVLSSYSQGLSPAEYFAAAYGARKGVLEVKQGTADAGYLGKQLNQLAHRLQVTAVDQEGPYPEHRGLPVDTSDPDNEGALLARSVGGFPANTLLTSKVLKRLQDQGLNRILVRSPIVLGPPEGGVYARDVGIREAGSLPGVGEIVGLPAAQALGEKLAQARLSAKHSGGVANAAAVGGFDYIQSMLNPTKTIKGGATHSDVDGIVERVEQAPAGGWHVFVGGKSHYVPLTRELRVKAGETVEAGDMLSDGIPNAAVLVHHKGIGEGRRLLTQEFLKAYRGSRLTAHRRNLELVARGLVDHIRLTDDTPDGIPDDLMSYQAYERDHQPREGMVRLSPASARGKYLESPVLHYSIGTKIRPSVVKTLQEFGIEEVDAHDDPPPFVPEMVRAANILQHDEDWMTRFYGAGLKRSLKDATHRGLTSTPDSTSFVPALAKGTDFGQRGPFQTPDRPLPTSGAAMPTAETTFSPAAPPRYATYDMLKRYSTSKMAEQATDWARVENVADFVAAAKKLPPLMPGYGDVFVRPRSGLVWVVSGDSDETETVDQWKVALQKLKGVRDVRVEAESYPPKDEMDAGEWVTAVWGGRHSLEEWLLLGVEDPEPLGFSSVFAAEDVPAIYFSPELGRVRVSVGDWQDLDEESIRRVLHVRHPFLTICDECGRPEGWASLDLREKTAEQSKPPLPGHTSEATSAVVGPPVRGENLPAATQPPPSKPRGLAALRTYEQNNPDYRGFFDGMIQKARQVGSSSPATNSSRPVAPVTPAVSRKATTAATPAASPVRPTSPVPAPSRPAAAATTPDPVIARGVQDSLDRRAVPTDSGTLGSLYEALDAVPRGAYVDPTLNSPFDSVQDIVMNPTPDDLRASALQAGIQVPAQLAMGLGRQQRAEGLPSAVNLVQNPIGAPVGWLQTAMPDYTTVSGLRSRFGGPMTVGDMAAYGAADGIAGTALAGADDVVRNKLLTTAISKGWDSAPAAVARSLSTSPAARLSAQAVAGTAGKALYGLQAVGEMDRGLQLVESGGKTRDEALAADAAARNAHRRAAQGVQFARQQLARHQEAGTMSPDEIAVAEQSIVDRSNALAREVRENQMKEEAWHQMGPFRRAWAMAYAPETVPESAFGQETGSQKEIFDRMRPVAQAARGVTSWANFGAAPLEEEIARQQAEGDQAFGQQADRNVARSTPTLPPDESQARASLEQAVASGKLTEEQAQQQWSRWLDEEMSRQATEQYRANQILLQSDWQHKSPYQRAYERVMRPDLSPRSVEPTRRLRPAGRP